MAVDTEDVYSSYYGAAETNANAADTTDDETEDEEYDYGEWRWNAEINDWYWVYYDDTDDEASSSTDEEYDAEDDQDYASSDEDDELQWEQEEGDQDDEQPSAEWEETEETGRTSWPPAKEQTLIVFDWDDTILPTSYLHEQLGSDSSSADLSQSMAKEVKLLEEQLIEILILARTLGIVKIITNAGEGWAEQSCESFMPNLYCYLVENSIPIISARSKFEDEFQGDQWQYKTKAFAQEAQKMFFSEYNGTSRFVSIGDSEYEHHAARRLKNLLPEGCIKIVKLNADYTPSSMRGQLEQLHFHLGSIVAREDHIDQFVHNIE